MNQQQEALYEEARELRAYNALALKAMCLWAFEHLKDKAAMTAASAAWDRNARYYGKAIEYFRADFDLIELSADDILSRVMIASLPQEKAQCVFEEMHDKTLSYWQVRERVAELRGHRERKPSLAQRDAERVRKWRSMFATAHIAHQSLSDCADELAAEPEVRKILEAKP